MKELIRIFLRRLHNSLPPRIQARVDAIRSSQGHLSLGQRAYIHHSAQILGRAFVRLGSNSVLSQDCWLNVNHRFGNALAIEIGDHCFIGRRNFFSSGRLIVLGNYVLTANDCHFLGSTHIVDDPLRPCLTTGTTDTDTITVGHNTFLGAGARVLGHVNIGHGCVIGACSLVTRDVPPFSQVAGFPATIRRRYSFPRKMWVDIAEFTDVDEAALPSSEYYLNQLQSMPPPRMPYLAAGNDMGQC